MTKVFKLMIAVINRIHDFIVSGTNMLGLNLTDKQLHFWLLGVIGIIIFIAFDAVFKQLAKWSISTITFIYTFTILVVLVLAIEIEQKVTQAGNMEFGDVVAGLNGFITFSIIYVLIRTLLKKIRK